MADERVRTELDGMLITAACPNHMNPVLSYADPQAVSQVKVIAGITPVSAGGDSIGGTILVESAAPRFAHPATARSLTATLSAFGRSNGGGVSTSGSVSAATEQHQHHLYRRLEPSSSDYKDGNGTRRFDALRGRRTTRCRWRCATIATCSSSKAASSTSRIRASPTSIWT